MSHLEDSAKMSIFSRAYWKSAVGQFSNTKVLCVMSVLVAINIAIGSVFVPVGINLRVYLTFIPTCIASIIGGPIYAACFGGVSDVLGYLVHPTGAFFPGYTLTAMVSSVIYALFLHNTKITILKISLAKLTVNVFSHIFLNSVWSAMLFGKGYYYFVAKSAVKNILMLPIEIIILALAIRVIIPIARKYGVVSENTVVALK